jgi:hypothetical protein
MSWAIWGYTIGLGGVGLYVALLSVRHRSAVRRLEKLD